MQSYQNSLVSRLFADYQASNTFRVSIVVRLHTRVEEFVERIERGKEDPIIDGLVQMPDEEIDRA